MNAGDLEQVATIARILRERLERCQGVVTESQAFERVKSALDDALAALSKLEVWGPENRLPSSELWRIAGDLLQTGWLEVRAREKPRGYAGDYELLERIADGRLCDHPLGRHLDRYFQEQAAPQAVRNRVQMAAEWIRQAALAAPGTCRVALVGSGPAVEIEQAAASLPGDVRRRLNVTLLDLDPQALASAARRLAPLLSERQLTLAGENIFHLPKRERISRLLAGADCILCTGLFDYLDASVAAAMLGEFWRRLAPGGTLAIFNFAPHNPTRAYMEWIGNWYLIYRGEKELRELACQASLPSEQCAIGAEPLGIDVFLKATKLSR